MRKLLALSLVTLSAHAGFNGLTIHSRANCYNNETISWDATRKWKLFTHSDHQFQGNWVCDVVTGWHKTWRSAAVHWIEGTSGGWKVSGDHLFINDKGHRALLGSEAVTDCSIYDGWWSIPSKLRPAQSDGNDGDNQKDSPHLSKVEQGKMVADSYKVMQAEFDEQEKEVKQNGYYKTDSDYAHYLLTLPTYSQDEIKEFSNTKDLEDTHLKQIPSQIKLAFPFNANKINKPIIGYAPLGSFIQGKGWTGIKVIFTDDNLTCSYSYFNLGLAHGYVENTNEQQNKLINGKDTVTNVEGDDATGYLYQVTLYTKLTMSMIECANKSYNPTFLGQTITLAKQIS